MPLPKGKLLALVAVFAAIGIAAGTGAFTTVTAERTATVSVAGDSSALLQLTDGSTNESSATTGVDYVDTTSSGQLEIDLTNVNGNASTTIVKAFNISNQGSQTVAVSISKDGPNKNAITFGVQNGQLDSKTPTADSTWPPTADFYDITAENGTRIDLQPGESIEVGIYIDTTDKDATDGRDNATALTSGEIINTVTIQANAQEVDSNQDSNTSNYDAA